MEVNVKLFRPGDATRYAAQRLRQRGELSAAASLRQQLRSSETRILAEDYRQSLDRL